MLLAPERRSRWSERSAAGARDAVLRTSRSLRAARRERDVRATMRTVKQSALFGALFLLILVLAVGGWVVDGVRWLARPLGPRTGNGARLARSPNWPPRRLRVVAPVRAR